MDDLAIKLFMADTGVDDETVAEGIMLRFGLADNYLAFAAKLQPFMEDDYCEAAIDGAIAIHDTIVAMRYDPSVIPNADFGKGVEFAMNTVHEVIDRVINMMENDTAVAEAVMPEQDPQSAFEAIFGVPPAR